MKRLPSQERLRALFHYQDGQLLWKERRGSASAGSRAGGVEANGYRVVRVDNCLYKEHRLIWKWVNGVDPADQLDHINRDKADNRIENLEEVDNRENCTRRWGTRDLPTGVYRKGGKYVARMWRAGKNLCLGYYGTIEEAAAAYRDALLRHKGTCG